MIHNIFFIYIIFYYTLLDNSSDIQLRISDVYLKYLFTN